MFKILSYFNCTINILYLNPIFKAFLVVLREHTFAIVLDRTMKVAYNHCDP